MIKKKKENRGMIEIDLTGPEGNAYVLLGYAMDLCKQLGLDYDKVSEEMKTSNYDNLVNVFDKHFGEFVILYK